MKKIVMVFLILTFALSFSAADEEMDIYADLYSLITEHENQLELLKVISVQNLPGAGDFYVTALRRLISDIPNLTRAADIGFANEQAQLLAEVLGEEKKPEAASDLWQLTEIFNRDPVLISTAMMTLGKMQDPTYFPFVLDTLEHMTNAPVRSDDLNNEIIAHGAIIALEYYNDTRAYLPIYFVTLGWFTPWVKNQAAETLQKLAPDSTPFMEELISNPFYSHPVKLGALQIIEDSNLSDARKAEIAATALDRTFSMHSAERGIQASINQSRKLALDMLGRYGVPDSSIYTLIDNCYIHATDNMEKLDAIVTLINLASDDSVRILNRHLTEMNVKRMTNTLVDSDYDLTIFLIDALGKIKNPNALPVLRTTAAMGWTGSIRDRARSAINQIEGL